MEEPEVLPEVLTETEHFSVWRITDPDGEMTYHLELGSVTVHFYVEEWDEFITLAKEAARATGR